ncbi:MAG: hypothetical protein QXR80_04175 [Desulfurococcaceae archaeon]
MPVGVHENPYSWYLVNGNLLWCCSSVLCKLINEEVLALHGCKWYVV